MKSSNSAINICYTLNCPNCHKKHIMFLNRNVKNESLTELSDRINNYVAKLAQKVERNESFFSNCSTMQDRKEKWRTWAKEKVDKYIGEEIPWEFCDTPISDYWDHILSEETEPINISTKSTLAHIEAMAEKYGWTVLEMDDCSDIDENDNDIGDISILRNSKDYSIELEIVGTSIKRIEIIYHTLDENFEDGFDEEGRYYSTDCFITVYEGDAVSLSLVKKLIKNYDFLKKFIEKNGTF